MSVPARTAWLAALGLALAATASAQTPPPKIESRDLALRWLTGRWAQPVTCERADGSTFERERAVSFKIDPGADTGRTGLRATFFGIEAPEAVRCFNLIERQLLDVRGVLYLHMRSSNREDLGVVDFRRMISDGSLEYHVTRGTLRWRAIGAGDDTWTAVEVPGGARLGVDAIRAGSDAARLFAARGLLPALDDPRAARLFRFELRGAPDLAFSAPLLEDLGRHP